MTTTNKLDKASINNLLVKARQTFNKYAVIVFLVFLALVYGFVVLDIVNSGSAEPTQESIDAEAQASATPHIDQKSVGQMQYLQDHSVNVKTLFNEARNNPFNE